MPTKYWRLAIESTLEDQTIVHTLGVKGDHVGVTDDFSASQVASEVDSWLTTRTKDMLPTGATVDTIKVVEFIPRSAGVPESAEHSVGSAGSGDFGGEELPRELVAHIKLRTNAAVRSGHGGFFSGPVWKRANLNDDGKTLKNTTGFWNAIKAMGDALLAGHDVTEVLLPLGHLSAVVLSRTRLERGDDDWAFDITGYSINTRPTWLRSRGR